MSSIVEGYRDATQSETVQDTFALPSLEDDDFVDHPLRPDPKGDEFKLRNPIINKAEESLEDKAYHELVTHLGGSVKAIDNDTHELTIMTGSASAIKIKVVGYEHPELVNVAKAREDAVVEELPPVETPRTTAPDSSLEATDQVAAVTKYNTDQYMKHSRLNPKKFG